MDEQRREDMTEQNLTNATPENTNTSEQEAVPSMPTEPQQVQAIPVQEAPRSQYPPNVGVNPQYQQNQPYQPNQAYQQWHANQQQPPAQQPKKKKKVGLIVFLIILAVVVTLSVSALVGVVVGKSIVENNNEDNNNGWFDIYDDDNDDLDGDEEIVPNNDGPELEIQDDGKADNEDADDIKIQDGKVLTAAQIAKKADNISVGVLVYSKNSDQLAGEGTGILMSLDSKKEYTYVITCAHVVDDANVSVMIQTNKGESYPADIVGVDSRTDVAVLKIKTNKLECAVFGNSDKLKVGDTVYAIGNPGGTEFFGSFTNGMVSAIDRPVNSEIGYAMKCIQHTAPINSGNSGGALLNSYGQVVGINSSKIMATGFEGMGFSIPITDAKEIVDQLIKYGRVTGRAKLGISYFTASNSEKSNMIIRLKDLPAGSLIIGDIGSDSDLADKDVQVNDIIVAVNGKDLTESSILLEKIENGKVGDELKLTIVRFDNNYNMKKFDVKVKLVEDKGITTTTQQEEPTTSFFFNPFE